METTETTEGRVNQHLDTGGQQGPTDSAESATVSAADDGTAAGGLGEKRSGAGYEEGTPVVEEVLRSMQGLAQRPVEEHVAVFEAAHEKLRAGLTGAGERTTGSGS